MLRLPIDARHEFKERPIIATNLNLDPCSAPDRKITLFLTVLE